MNNITVTLSFDGNRISQTVPYGTTAQQLAANGHVRAALGLPANATPMVNGATTTNALNDGDNVTFVSAPTQKA